MNRNHYPLRYVFAIRLSPLLPLLLCFLLTGCSSITGYLDPTPQLLLKPIDHQFEGKVIIIGAGASGLAAASILEQQGIDYQTLEATDHYGGRTQKNIGFADFPIDLGAEWIHQDKSILNRLIGHPGNLPDVELIPYQPMDIYYVEDQSYEKESPLALKFYYWMLPEYKFKRSTWFDYIDRHFAARVKHRIIFNAVVSDINYEAEKTIITTTDNQHYHADKVIVTVPIGVLQSNAIAFHPKLPALKKQAIQSVEFLPGFKLIMKFSERFYPDIVDFDTDRGEKTFYDIAYKKEAQDHVLGLLSMGSSTIEYYEFGSKENILKAVLAELDNLYDGQATKHFTGQFLFEDWGRNQYTLGTWTNDFKNEKLIDVLNAPLADKIYFAGEAHDIYEQTSTVPGAIMSGYTAVYKILNH